MDGASVTYDHLEARFDRIQLKLTDLALIVAERVAQRQAVIARSTPPAPHRPARRAAKVVDFEAARQRRKDGER